MELLSGTTSSFEEANAHRWLVCIWFSIVICFIAAEILDLNHFVRTWVQGNAFWIYMVSFLVVMGAGLSFMVLAVPFIQKFSTWKALLLGTCVGFVSGLLAILLNPLLLGKGLTLSSNAWRNPLQLVIASIVSMGWFYGAVAVLSSLWLANRKYTRVGYILAACAFIRILEWIANFFALRTS